MVDPLCLECHHPRSKHNRAGHDSGGCSVDPCACLDYKHDDAVAALRKRYAEFLVAKGNLIEAIGHVMDVCDNMERPSEYEIRDLSDRTLGGHMGWLLGKNMLTRDVRLVIEATLAIPESERFEALGKEDDDG